LRPQHSHALRHFEREAGGHDLAPDGGHVRALQRAGVVFLHLGDDLGGAVGAEERGALAALERAHFFGDLGALVEQRQQLGVERVDAHAQPRQVVGLPG